MSSESADGAGPSDAAVAGPAGEMSRQAKIAKRTWEVANQIVSLPPSKADDIYYYDRAEQVQILAAKPWEKE
jgi:COP9 signalosome complex subunit 5